MSPNTVYVGRPTKWGNPWTIKEYGREDALRLYESWLREEILLDPDFLEPLKGKDLACWCPLDKPCHADVILKVLGEKPNIGFPDYGSPIESPNLGG